MYWSGHRWRHETNAQGFRGRPLERADAVFLGDSMIYGHGVEEADTVAARFERATGLATANLGQQGTFPIQAYMILARKGVLLKPRVVLLCVHLTDIEDALVYYEEEELRRFAEQPPSSAELPRVKPFYQPSSPWTLTALWSQKIALPTESGAVLGAVARALRGKRAGVFVPRDPFVPTPEDVEAPLPAVSGSGPERDQIAWKAVVQSLARIKHVSDQIGARLVLFDLGYPNALSQAVEAQALALGAEYSPAGRVVLERARAGDDVYLANDGHWSGTGAEVAAQELKRSVMAPRNP
jgi:hypothetical protein